jgi:DNA modification methylase
MAGKNGQLKWHTEKRKLSELTPFEHNPRQLTEKQYADLKKSLTKFDLAEIPAIDVDGKIIAGHQRLKILSEIKGLDHEIDVRLPNRKLTKSEFKEYNIRSNKNTGSWDMDVLANDFELTELLEWGFDEKELDLNLWNKTPEEKLDEVPEAQKEAISKTGDLFLLDGKHRVMCGDSTLKEDVDKLMGGKKADMVFTDPPYNIGFNYNKHKDKMDITEYQKFLVTTLSLITTDKIIITPGPRNIYLWYGIKEPTDIGTWHKSNSRSGASCFHFRTSEPILFYGKFENKRNTDFFDYNRSIDAVLTASENGLEEVAPAKPIKLIADIINSYSKNRDLLQEPFLGSGTTLIACEQTNRICYGIEIDPIYIDVILRRYHNLYPDKEIKCLNRKDFNFEKLFISEETSKK